MDTEEKKLTSAEIDAMLREVEEIHRPRRTVNKNRKPKKRFRLDRLIAFSTLFLLLVAVIVIVIKMFSGGNIIGNNSETTTKQTASKLQDDKYPEITELVQNYLKAYLIVDDDKRMETFRECVMDLDDLNSIKRRDYVASYSDVECYTKEGPYEGTYIVYAYYKVTYKNISTPDPNINTLYVMRQGESNNVYIKNKIPDDVKEYIDKVSNDKDVQALFDEVKAEHEAAMQKDDNLLKFFTDLEKLKNEKSNTK